MTYNSIWNIPAAVKPVVFLTSLVLICQLNQVSKSNLVNESINLFYK